MISLKKMTDELHQEYSIYTDIGNFERTIRRKYDFLIRNIVMRSKLDFKSKNKHMIPDKDVPIVKALLIKSYDSIPSDSEDEIFVDWFNGNIMDTDYEKIIELGRSVTSLISELYQNNFDIDDVTKDEWINAIHSSINFNKALNIMKIEEKLSTLYESSSILNHDIPFGDLIIQNEFGERAYQWKGLQPCINVNDPLSDSLKGCFSQNDYLEVIYKLIDIITHDSTEKAIGFIKAYAQTKKAANISRVDELFDKDTLATEYTRFFQNIYEFLNKHKKLTDEIEREIGVSDLLTFFKMKDRKD